MRFEAIAASLVLLLLVGLAQALALDGDGGEDAALKLSQLPSGSILLQDWEDYALSPELLQPLTVPPLTTTTIKNQDGRDGCPAEQPNFFWRCARPRWQGCGYGQECCCGKCHPKYMVYCNSDGFWGEPFFHDACMSGCPTEPTTTTSTEGPELDLGLELAVIGPKPAQIYEPMLGTLSPATQTTTGPPTEGWPWSGSHSASINDCDSLEQRIAELEREKTRLEAQRSSCPSSSSASATSSSSAAAPTMIPTSAPHSLRHSTNLPWFGQLSTTTDNANG